MNKWQLAGLSLLSGILLYAAWPVSPLTICIFFALIPLLLVADNTRKHRSFFWYTFLALLAWNATTTWWIWNSTDVGSIAAIAANSLLMCLPWWGYHVFKTKFNKRIGYSALITFWMLFEYIHLNWQLSWPWLTMGNVFASHPGWVQWYEYTGAGGGTLWVLLTNIAIYELVIAIKEKQQKGKRILVAAIFLFTPFIISLVVAPGAIWVLKPGRSATADNVLIIQPNIDPYGKFESSSIGQQVQHFVTLSEQHMDSSTKLIIWPETAMSAGDAQQNTGTNSYYRPIFQFLMRHPGVTLLSGIETYKVYGTEKATPTAHLNSGMYMDEFNAAVNIKAGQPLQYYYKMKLVPGVESLPTFLNFMAPVFEKFGGTAGGYGRDTGTKAFTVPGNPYVTAPVICYESIYGEHVASYVSKGANILTIITNDGWWGNTPGYKQHLQYARLRAVETRRWVARSANTGTSAVIDNMGNLIATQPWDTVAFIKYAIPVTTRKTIYVQYGDYLYEIASLLALLMIIWNIVLWAGKRGIKK